MPGFRGAPNRSTPQIRRSVTQPIWYSAVQCCRRTGWCDCLKDNKRPLASGIASSPPEAGPCQVPQASDPLRLPLQKCNPGAARWRITRTFVVTLALVIVSALGCSAGRAGWHRKPGISRSYIRAAIGQSEVRLPAGEAFAESGARTASQRQSLSTPVQTQVCPLAHRPLLRLRSLPERHFAFLPHPRDQSKSITQ